MEQGGVKSITLYDPNDATFDYINADNIVNLAGTSIELSNEKRPNLSFDIQRISRKLKFNYKIDFTLFDLTQTIISQIKANINGWFALVEFYKSESYFINTPFFFTDTALNTNETNKYLIPLTNNEPTERLLKVSPGNWILKDGTWNDLGVWVDSDVWID